MRRLVILAILICSTILPARAQTANKISTVAGGGTNGSNATSAYLPSAFGVAYDSITGNTYISLSGYSIVYKVAPSGTMTPYAGTGIIGFSGDGGPATSAQLDSPYGLAVDGAGDLFIADANNNRIREVNTKGIITTVAGSGNQYDGIGFFGGYSGDGGPATSALLNFPDGVAVDKNGNLFIADANNNLIRKVDNTPDHIITTYAGIPPNSSITTCAAETDAVGDSCPATEATLNSPTGVTVDSSGNVFIADTSDSLVRIVNTAAPPVINAYAGTLANGCNSILGDGGAATSASLCAPEGVFIDSTETLYIADTFYNRIRKVDNTVAHDISTIAGNAGICLNPTGCGDGGSPTAATLNSPVAVGLNGADAVLIGDAGSNRFRIVTQGASPAINNFAGGGTGGDTGLATSAVIGQPFFVIADSSADLYVFDTDGARIREVNAGTQDITDFAGNGAIGPPGQKNGDGGSALSASFTSNVHGMAFDPSGNMYVIDRGNFIVREVSAGSITKFAGTYGTRCPSGTCGDGGSAASASFGAPTGIATDANGNVYIADGGANRIRVVCVTATCPISGATAGNIYDFAGSPTGTPGSANGQGASATFNGPWGIVVDTSSTSPTNGDLFVADANNNLIRMIDTNGNVTTYAFNGQPTFGGDGGAATSASMQFPQQVALDRTGNLFVGGGFDNVVQRIDA